MAAPQAVASSGAVPFSWQAIAAKMPLYKEFQRGLQQHMADAVNKARMCANCGYVALGAGTLYRWESRAFPGPKAALPAVAQFPHNAEMVPCQKARVFSAEARAEVEMTVRAVHIARWALQATREVQASVAEWLEAACRLAAAGRPPAHIDGLVRTPAKSTCRLYHPPGPARQAASPPKSGNPSLPLPSPALPCPVTTHPPQRRSSPAERGPPDRQSGSAPYFFSPNEN